MTMLQALILAIVQGATELFPVSSLGHAVVLPRLLNWNMDEKSVEFLPFLVVLHFGTATALLAYFWRDWRGFIEGVLGRGGNVQEERRLFKLIIIATLPAVVLGFLFEHILRNFFGSPSLAASFLIVNGFFLYFVDRMKFQGTQQLSSLDWRAALLIGACQALALIPGLSRSGVTMAGGLMAGLNHKEAARFSFLLATPIIIGAGVLEIPKLRHIPNVPNMAPAMGTDVIILSGLIAGIVSWLSVVGIMYYFKKHEIEALRPFAYYCWLAGVVAIIMIYYFR